MKTLLALLGSALLLGAASVHADEIKMHIPPGNYAKKIGNSQMPDPDGKLHSRKQIAGKVVVAIFSAPNMSQGDVQQKWADLLATNPKTKVSDHVGLFLVEDMSQAGMFKGMALDSMKKDFTPTSRPFLILDNDGKVFKKFGVPRGKTEILIYDKDSVLRDVETDLSDEDLTVKRIRIITHRLLEE